MDRLKNQPAVGAAAAVLAVMAAFGVLKTFATDTMPWLVSWLGGNGGIALAALATGIAAYGGLQWWRYRDAVKKITRDYYAEKSTLEHQLDPKSHGEVTARVGFGQADPDFGNEVLRRYGLPPERKFD